MPEVKATDLIKPSLKADQLLLPSLKVSLVPHTQTPLCDVPDDWSRQWPQALYVYELANRTGCWFVTVGENGDPMLGLHAGSYTVLRKGKGA